MGKEDFFMTPKIKIHSCKLYRKQEKNRCVNNFYDGSRSLCDGKIIAKKKQFGVCWWVFKVKSWNNNFLVEKLSVEHFCVFFMIL